MVSDTDRSSSAPAMSVLRDPWLLRHVTSFQGGMPVALSIYWKQVDPETMQRYSDNRMRLLELTRQVAAKGSLRDLELLARVTLRMGSIPSYKRLDPDYTEVAPAAAKNNRADMLQWAIGHGHRPSDIEDERMWRGALEAYAPGDLRVLDLLRAHFPLSPHNISSSVEWHTVSKSVDIHLVQWLHTHYPYAPIPTEMATYAAERNDTDMIRFLVEQRRGNGIKAPAVSAALTHGYYDLLDYMLAKKGKDIARDSDSGKFQITLVEDERAEMQALVDKYPEAVPWGFQHLVKKAVKNNDVEHVRKWYEDGRLDKLAPIAIWDAVWHCSLDTIRFLLDKGLTEVTKETMDYAAKGAAWTVVDFLHTHRKEGCTTDAMDQAAKHGDLDRVRWFHENRSEGCSQEAMRLAAENGHLDVIRFLHENTTVGCTTDAMDAAVMRCHFDIIHYLAKNRTEGCTVDAVVRALRAPRLDVVTVLYGYYPHLFGPGLLYELLLRGAFEIYMTVREKYPDDADEVLAKTMVDAGHEMELTTIRFILDTLDRKDLAHLAMDGAALTANERWVQILYRITGPGSCRLSAVRNAVEAQDCYDEDTVAHIPFIVENCSEPGAREIAISTAERHNEEVAELMEDWDDFVSRHTVPFDHPFLQDTRTPDWVITAIADKGDQDADPDNVCGSPFTWAVRAAFKDDAAFLDVIRDLPPGTTEMPLHLASLCEDDYKDYEPFSFEGARPVAVRAGSLSVLQWLINNLDTPVEPTLLCEALLFHNFEVADWLVAHCPTACTDLDWTHTECGNYHDMSDEVLDWLEAHGSVRNALPVNALIECGIADNDVVALRRYHQWFSETFMANTMLRSMAQTANSDCVLTFLDEIGYPHA